MNTLLSVGATTASSSNQSSANVRVITRRTEIHMGSPEQSSPTTVQRRVLPASPRYSSHLKGSSIKESNHERESTMEMLSTPSGKIIHWPSTSGGKPKFLPELNIIQPCKTVEHNTIGGEQSKLTLPTIVSKMEEDEPEIPNKETTILSTSTRKQEKNSRRVMNAMISLMNGSKKVQPSPVVVETQQPIVPPSSSQAKDIKQKEPQTAMIPPHDAETSIVIMSSKSTVLPPHNSWFMQAKRRAQSVTNNLKIGTKPSPPSPEFTPVM